MITRRMVLTEAQRVIEEQGFGPELGMPGSPQCFHGSVVTGLRRLGFQRRTVTSEFIFQSTMAHLKQFIGGCFCADCLSDTTKSMALRQIGNAIADEESRERVEAIA